ncbi:MAG: TraR/DksA family transcriptional regulator [Syntrophobacteraceae bacterium]|jgi:DnaK suppressor protein|nr:TraR/DksA family transcriptional regulator [Syntrophobacteraceae bacterium]
MDKEMLKYFSGALNRQLMEALPEATGMLPGLLEAVGHREPMDEVDFASMHSSRELGIRIHRHHHMRVREILAAIHRLSEGEYGICVECGDEIAVDRLKAQPVTTVCLSCRRHLEVVSRRGSHRKRRAAS